jgi:peptide methionine sulfoxide reductase msrA/msrB
VERYLGLIPAVLRTEVGYANGHEPDPTYERVKTGLTGYVEAVKAEYDPARIELAEILDAFYQIVDPTSVNRQGNDVGPQYRVGVYFLDEADWPVIATSLARLARAFNQPLTVDAGPLKNFYPAEEFHQKFLENRPEAYCHVSPRLLQAASRTFGAAEEIEARERLSPRQCATAIDGDTEPPFRNEYFDLFEPGVYVDVLDGTPLFLSTHKFESGCGWPSFSQPIDEKSLQMLPDLTLNRERTEIRASASGAHLGHVFPDGPVALGGLRHCLNSSSLRFVPKDRMAEEGYGALLPRLEAEEKE